MDLLAQLFNPNKPLPIIRVPTGQVGGDMVADSDEEQDEYEEFMQAQSADCTTNYAKEYQKREEELYAKFSKAQDELQDEPLCRLEGHEDMLSMDARAEVDNLKHEELLEVFSKYSFDKQQTLALTIDSYREEILNFINTNDVVIIQGPTGCGKTTRVPQFILDDCKAQRKACKIVVTQPRRIAAISVARRVCEERSWAVGTVCGYQVGLESTLNPETLLGYVTTGVLLQKLIKDKSLSDYTHIIIDEVHERNQDMDFLLLVIRRYLFTHSPNTKVILMSATFDTEEFANYFMSFVRQKLISAPVIYVSKNNKYNTQVFYAEQLKSIGTIPDYSIAEPKINPCLYELFVVLIRAFNRLDPEDPLTNTRIIGNVLVFLPGILEIEEAHDRLMASSVRLKQTEPNHIEWLILPLHSSITTDEQRRVFQPPPPGQRKIILSTNIAESSITVPDILYVVDFCLTKTMIMDPDTQYQSLQLQWASHINCTQRAGRVGRVADGRVYRLVTRQFYESTLPKKVQPEILRAPLSRLVLSAKLMELHEPPKAILALAMNPPNLSNIETTILYLKEIGALSTTCNGQRMVSDGDLTFLGRVMSALPLDVHLSKFILLGHIFSCLNDCIIMATGCSLNTFKSPFKERLKAYGNRLQWADGSSSDLIAHLNLYKVWLNMKRMNVNARVELDWCKRNYVSQRSLKEWQILVKEVTDRLHRMHITQGVGPGHVVLNTSEIPTVIKVVICGAFYPNYFRRSSDAGQVDEREAVKTLGGRDPFNTIYFTGFDSLQPGPLYSKSIKKLLADISSNMHVSFDSSSKVYVQFYSHQVESVRIDGREYVTSMPGKIKGEVYRAVRLRQLRIPNKIPIMNKENAWELAKSNGIVEGAGIRQLPILARANTDTDEPPPVVYPPVIPTIDIQHITITISERIDAGHFWAQNADEDTTNLLSIITKTLNTKSLEPAERETVTNGGLYATRYKVDSLFYRCKVLSVIPFGKKQTLIAQIIFIDYGNTASVGLEELFVLPQLDVMTCPAQAMECFLSEIQPSVVLNPRALWSDAANVAFDRQTQNKILHAKVYSVVRGVVHLELHNCYNVNQQSFQKSLNAWLIQQGYAQPAEESFLSKENHLKRLQLLDNPEKAPAFLKEEKGDVNMQDVGDVEPPSSKSCPTEIVLKGPFSPLEMSIYCVVASGSCKHVTIEGNSVNAVLLDTDPQDPHERLVVAAHISQTPNGTGLSLRHTTVMPNIHGFPMLMSLLFCPIMEPKPTENGSRIGAILCGLGAHDNSYRSIYPPHDVCLTLDTDLTTDDINKINELRYWMNMAVQSMESDYQEIAAPVKVEECQRELKAKLFELLRTPRKSVERVYVKHANVWGKTMYDADMLKPGDVGSIMRTEIWPLHWAIKLNEEDEEKAKAEKHMQELEEVALRMRVVNEIRCNFCNETFYSTDGMRQHLASTKHHKAVDLQMAKINK